MLILFKPWRKAANLHGDVANWPEAFDEFRKSCAKEMQGVMDNMQILHECKDSKNHYQTRRIYILQNGTTRNVRNQGTDKPNMDEVLDHIFSQPGPATFMNPHRSSLHFMQAPHHVPQRHLVPYHSGAIRRSALRLQSHQREMNGG